MHEPPVWYSYRRGFPQLVANTPRHIITRLADYLADLSRDAGKLNTPKGAEWSTITGSVAHELRLLLEGAPIVYLDPEQPCPDPTRCFQLFSGPAYVELMQALNFTAGILEAKTSPARIWDTLHRLGEPLMLQNPPGSRLADMGADLVAASARSYAFHRELQASEETRTRLHDLHQLVAEFGAGDYSDSGLRQLREAIATGALSVPAQHEVAAQHLADMPSNLLGELWVQLITYRAEILGEPAEAVLGALVTQASAAAKQTPAV